MKVVEFEKLIFKDLYREKYLGVETQNYVFL